MSGVTIAERWRAPRRFKPYPAYKDSGIAWLGEIPAGWAVVPFKRRLASVKDGTHASFERVLEGVPLLSAKNIGVDGLLQVSDAESVISATDYEQINRNGYLRLGDLLLTIVGTIGRAAVFEHSEPVAFQRSVAVLRPTAEIWVRFLLHQSQADFFQRALRHSSKQSAQGGVYLSDVAELPILCPPKPEQRAIADFLDRETARIDALVAKKERLIELLRERRTALITRAVTKGLDANVPMKDSGVEWLGRIPAHWEVMRIKWAARMVSGHTPDKKVGSYWQGGDIPWVSLADTGHLREVDYIASTAVMTTPDGIAHSSAHVLPPGTVVFSRDATIGLCAITRAGMAVSQHFIGWVCTSRLQPEYLLHVLRSMTQELERLTMGATVRTIGMPDVKSLVAPIPPAPEQNSIVLHVRQQREQVDSLVAKVRDAIDRLKELRTALISAAVTGKIDVREVEA